MQVKKRISGCVFLENSCLLRGILQVIEKCTITQRGYFVKRAWSLGVSQPVSLHLHSDMNLTAEVCCLPAALTYPQICVLCEQRLLCILSNFLRWWGSDFRYFHWTWMFNGNFFASFEILPKKPPQKLILFQKSVHHNWSQFLPNVVGTIWLTYCPLRDYTLLMYIFATLVIFLSIFGCVWRLWTMLEINKGSWSYWIFQDLCINVVKQLNLLSIISMFFYATYYTTAY